MQPCVREGSADDCSPKRMRSGRRAGIPAMACRQASSSDLCAMAYPCRVSSPPINDTPPEKNRTTQTAARAGSFKGASNLFPKIWCDHKPAPEHQLHVVPFPRGEHKDAAGGENGACRPYETTRLDVSVEEKRDREHQRQRQARGRNSRSRPRGSIPSLP